MDKIGHKRGLLAISPVIVFLLLYLVVSLVVGDFYKMPLSVALVVSSVWAVAIYRGVPLSRRIDVFSKEAGGSNVLYMVWIFILAGAFASLAKEVGAVEATVDLALQYLPSGFFVPGLFVAACFISLAIGTSVGTVVALAPLAVQLAQSSDVSVPFMVATVLGGAFFGDNMSIISDTTIAATRTQGCDMRDKFRANLWISMPAALIVLVVYIFAGGDISPDVDCGLGDWMLVLPYAVVIVAALIGLNVTLVLILGIVAAFLLALFTGHDALALVSFMGDGIDAMGNLIIVTMLAAGMLGLVKALGGITYVLQCMSSRISGKRGAQAGIALLVSLVNVCTANNTVAIITVGSLAKDISKRYGVDPRKSASLLDTCSCIVQCLIPYGAQTLLAATLAGISPVDLFSCLYYPWALILMVLLSVLFRYPRHLS